MYTGMSDLEPASPLIDRGIALQKVWTLKSQVELNYFYLIDSLLFIIFQYVVFRWSISLLWHWEAKVTWISWEMRYGKIKSPLRFLIRELRNYDLSSSSLFCNVIWFTSLFLVVWASRVDRLPKRRQRLELRQMQTSVGPCRHWPFKIQGIVHVRSGRNLFCKQIFLSQNQSCRCTRSRSSHPDSTC